MPTVQSTIRKSNIYSKPTTQLPTHRNANKATFEGAYYSAIESTFSMSLFATKFATKCPACVCSNTYPKLYAHRLYSRFSVVFDFGRIADRCVLWCDVLHF